MNDTHGSRQGPRGARSASGRAAALGNTGNSSSAKSDAARQRRWELRDKGRNFVDRTPVEKHEYGPTGELIATRTVARGDKYLACGHRVRTMADGVGVRLDRDTNRAGYENLQRCGSVWSCPVCSAQIMQARQSELRTVATFARTEGHTLAMPTLTVRHKRTDSLTDVWDAVSSGWASVTSGSQWVSERPEVFQERLEKWEAARQLALEGKGRFPRGGRANIPPRRRIGDQERFGILGWARAVEVRDGDNGWHVHVHAVLVVKEGQGSQLRAKLAGHRMWQRWVRGIEKAGFDADRKHGINVAVEEAARQRLEDYISKEQDSDAITAQARRQNIRDALGNAAGQIAREATLGHHKLGKLGSRAPFQILADIDYETDPAEARRLEARWREWVAGSEGRRQLTWSKGLRELAGLAETAQTDEELVNEDKSGELVLTLELDGWLRIRRHVLQLTLLEVVEREGVDGLRAVLDRDGIRYRLPRTQAQQEWAEAA